MKKDLALWAFLLMVITAGFVRVELVIRSRTEPIRMFNPHTVYCWSCGWVLISDNEYNLLMDDADATVRCPHCGMEGETAESIQSQVDSGELAWIDGRYKYDGKIYCPKCKLRFKEGEASRRGVTTSPGLDATVDLWCPRCDQWIRKTLAGVLIFALLKGP